MASYKKEYLTDRLYFNETPFNSLMRDRIIEVLLVCSNYDRFILEEDGRIDEQLFQEYVSLGLRYPPRFSFIATEEEAFELMERRKVDLVISMLGACGPRTFEFERKIKQRHPTLPVVVLTRFDRELSIELERNGAKPFKYVFSWLGNARLLLAIVKLVEDAMNVDHDVNRVGVQTIILVENSVRYCSSYLPMIYGVLIEQAAALMREGLNEHQRTLRMRGRPKILLASNYEQAVHLYERYRSNLLGVISDIAYDRGGEPDRRAGLVLSKHIRNRDSELPILLQSTNRAHAEDAATFNAAFLHKESKTLLNELSAYIQTNFGFGDFVFRMPETLEGVGRASSLADMQRKIGSIPGGSLDYHARNNHFSKWLKARALYTLANILRPKKVEDFDDIESVREYLVDTIKNFRLHMGRGTIANFDRSSFDEYAVFQRIGNGSLGGKARGIAFINAFLKRNRIMFRFGDVTVQIPKTVALTTDIFDQFMANNDLYDIALSDRDDDEILTHFRAAQLGGDVVEDLRALVAVIKRPLAVRSSSILEDSRFQPFAGVYATYFVPNDDGNVNVRVRELCDAIKGVYASTYFRRSKQYALATKNLIDHEKMAVVIQEVTGARYGRYYYPNISGVARSLNFYPLEREQPEEGVVNVALGLGKTVVEGHASLRFSPAHPKKLIQLSDPKIAIRSTQKAFFAIDMTPHSFRATTDQSSNLAHLPLQEAAQHPANGLLLSTYDAQNELLREDPRAEGRKVATFAPILKHQQFPLSEILQSLLEVGSSEMKMPVELEFAVHLDVPEGEPKRFKVLQIRPIVDEAAFEQIDLGKIEPGDAIVSATTALGNGLYDDLHDILYVKPDAFDPSRSREVAERISRLNQRLVAEQRRYILIGPGRWGSTDPWLGIPVRWADITNAGVIVEASLPDFRVEASQGTHFFQNLTSFQVAYLTVDPAAREGNYDAAFLDQQPPVHEDDLLRWVRLDSPALVKVDGRLSGNETKAVVLKPRALS